MLVREGRPASRLAVLAERVQRVEEMLLEVMAHTNSRVVAVGRSTDNNPVTILHTDVYSGLPREIAIRVLGRTIRKAAGGRPELGKLEVF